MRRFASLAACVLSAALASTAAAQQRPINGTVVDSGAGAPIGGALVSVRGARLSATTLDNGTFAILNAPAGALTLQVRAIGYRRQDVAVAAGQNTVRVSLVRDVFRIEEIVITGRATGIERRNLANAVATIRAEDLGAVPSSSLEHQLQGRVAGADIQTNGGAPGGGVQVRLRGITSVNADAQPLYVVDGVIVSDVAIPSNQNAVTNAAGGSNPSLEQDVLVNRIADLDPNDIETIEILKGASASAIYGGRASNGVVIITTRRGRVGAPRVNVTQRFGFFDLANSVGTRRFNSVAEVDAAYGAGFASSVGWTPGTYYDPEEALAGRNALSSETNVSVSGGAENTRYFASGVLKNDEGIIANTGFERQGIRLNLDQRIGSRLNASLSSDFLHSTASRGLTNNDNTLTSFYMALAFVPSVVDLSRRPNGSFPSNPLIPSNPLQTAALMRNDENVYRFIGSGRLDLDVRQTATSSLRVSGVGGVDFFTQENDLFFPRELQFEPSDGLAGTALLSNSNSLNYNLDAFGVYTRTPLHGRFTSTTSAGVQYGRRQLDVSRIVGRNLASGATNVDAASSVQVTQNHQLIRNAGYFLQQELLAMNERLLVTLGVRADQSSVNSEADRLFFYPKASVSYRWPQGVAFADELKLRLAYGESGNEPAYGQRFTPLLATNNVGGLPGYVVGGTIAASDLRPERQREFEFGLDATLFEARANIEFSVYQKNISDLLLPRALAPSSGFLTQILNGGSMRTRGVEVALGVIPVRTRALEWFLRSTFSLNRSRITRLDVPAFLAGGFGTSIGAFRIEEGASATQIVGNDTLGGQIVVRKIGDATPDFRMSFNNDLNYGRWNLRFLLDWQSGSEILNLTKLLWDFGQTWPDYAEPIPNSTQTVGSRRLAGFQSVAANYMESASFLKLREIALTYEMPESMAQRLWSRVRTARLSVSARNLLTITPYTGLDPEVSNFGNQAVARNIDVAPFPPSRSLWFTVHLGF